MSFDGVVVRAITNELKQNLIGARINKIFQENKDDLFLVFPHSTLLLSTNHNYSRIHFAERKSNPINKTENFCMFLRKHIQSGIIKDIQQVLLDRIVVFEIVATNPFKEEVEYKLIIELLGRFSNLILTDQHFTILDCIKHVSATSDHSRILMPKFKYLYPDTSGKLNIFTAEENEIRARLHEKEEALDSFLPNTFLGITSNLASEFISRKGEQSFTLESILLFRDFVLDLLEHPLPLIFYDQDTPKDFYITDLSAYALYKKEKKESISVMLHDYYHKKANLISIGQKTAVYRSLVQTTLNKNIKKRTIHLENIEKSKNCEIYKQIGDILLANLYSIQNGSKSVVLENFYANNEPITISMDETMNVTDNAKKYYDKYNKAKRTYTHSKKQLEIVEDEIRYLDSLQSYIENAISEEDVKMIKEELEKGEYLKIRMQNYEIKETKHSKQKNISSEPSKYISSDGHLIYVGRNNLQNDEVTFKFGKENDIWFHVKDIPGSHVIIKLKDPKDLVHEETLIEAATLATFFSKGRASSNVAVDYTKRKHVKKPSGSKPGFVIYTDHKTIHITVENEILDRLKVVD